MLRLGASLQPAGVSEVRVAAMHLHQQHLGAIARMTDAEWLELAMLLAQSEPHQCEEAEAESEEDEGLDECSHRGSFLWGCRC